MALALVRQPDYRGVQGANCIYAFRDELVDAFEQGDWQKMRRLDQGCADLVDKVIAVNSDTSICVVQALKALRDFYAELLGVGEGVIEQAG